MAASDDLLREEAQRIREQRTPLFGTQPERPSDKLLTQEADAFKARLNTTLDLALPRNPDKAAEAKTLAERFKIDVDTVQANQDEIARMARVKDLQNLMQTSPVLARQLTDLQFAEIAHDDTDTLKAIETRVGRGLAYVMGADGKGGLPRDLRIGLYNKGAMGSAAAFRAVTEVGAVPFDFLEQFTSIGGNPVRRLSEGFGMIAEQQSRIIERDSPTSEGIIGSGVSSGVQSAAQNAKYLPLLAFGPVGAAAALTGMSLESGGTSYQQAREKGVAVLPSLIYGASDAAIEFATERIPVGNLLSDLGVGTPFYKILLRQMAAEIPGEQAATVLQDLNEWAVLNPEKTFNDYLAERPSAAAQTLIATIVGTGGNVTVTKGIDMAFDAMGQKFVAAQQAERNAQAFQQLNDLVNASKVLQRDPETFQAFVEQANQDGPVQDVFIDARIFNQAAMDAGITAEQLPASVQAQLAEALQTGGDLRIPVAEYATQIAPTEYAQSLLDHLKTDPQGMSRAEAQVFMQSQSEALQAEVQRVLAEKQADDAFNAGAEQVRTYFTDQLAQANRFTPEVNEAYSSLLSNFYAVTAARAGMTPQQLLERYPLRVQAEGVQGAAAQYDQQGQLITDSPEFQNWFGESQVRDADGKPLVVYNGSAADFVEFDRNEVSPGWYSFGRSFFFSQDPGAASEYANKEGGNLKPVYLSIKNPYVVSDPAAFMRDMIQRYGRDGAEAARNDLQAQGFDGIHYTQSGSFVAFRPEQIKSVFNRGTFDPNDQNILFQWAGLQDGSVALRTLADEGNNQAILAQALIDRLGLSPQELADVLVGIASLSESDRLGSVPALQPMLTEMRGAILDNPQILDAVVGSVPVDMVNNLAGSEAAAKVLLNDQAVLEDSPAFNADLPVSEGVDAAGTVGLLVREAAFRAAELARVTLGPRGESQESAAAVGAGQGNRFSQGSTPRAQIAFGTDITSTPSIITLFKNADLTSFLHESGHFFLEVQFDLASRIALEAQAFGASTNTPGEQQILEDTNALLKWFGVESIEQWFALPMEQKRSYHEQFARGFEAYLFEGKAPSIEMQGLFQRFRAWMLRVYKELKNLNVELTDEVRSVMDRMIATTEQIQLAEAGRSMLPLFTSPQQAGMTTEEFAAYQALGVDASNDAIQDLQARTLRDLAYARNARGREIKRLQKEAAGRRAEMRVEARREIMSQPVYRAWQFLTNKLTKDDRAAVATEPPKKSVAGPVDPEVDSLFVAIAKLGGLDRAQVESLWGWDKKERTPQPMFGKPLLRREGGMAVDAMGEALAELGYLPKDENGKYDQADFEAAFDSEYRGNEVFAAAKNYADSMGERRPGDGVDFEVLGAGRFELFALQGMDFPPEIVEIIKNLGMTAKDGIHPDIVAEEFGFTSGDELVRRLAIAESPKEAIEGLTDQKMLERYGDLATPEAIERAADVAIHNETRARFVAAELNAINKATGKPKVLASAARDYAKQMIDRLLVRNVKPTQYAAAEARAAKAAEQAMKAGDTAQAAVEKRNQLINTYATKAAYDAQAEVEKALRYFAKFDGKGVRKSIDIDYLDQIDTILERFDLRKGQSLKSVDKRKALAAWIEEQEELGIEVELPEKVRAEAFRQSYKDMTVEEMRALVDSIKQIEHLGRLKEKLLTARDNRRFADVVTQITNSIEDNAGNKRVNNRTRDTLGNRALNLFKGFVASHRKVASLAREMDGFKDAGPLWTYFIQSMNEAGDREATMRAEATQKLADLLKPVMAQGSLTAKGKFFPTIGESLTRGEQLVMALNMGNEGNLQRLLDGRGWTLQQVTPVMQNLSEADWRFVQQVWDFFESYRPMIGAKERRVMGKEPQWVEPVPVTVTTKEGKTITLPGGYFPIVYDSRESGRAEQFADAEAAKQMMKGAFVAATTKRSFTKSRAEQVRGRPLMLTWDALFRGANDVIHDLSWHEWVIDANRIIRNDEVDQAIRTRYGADVVQQFKSAIRDIAAGEQNEADALSRVFKPLRIGASVAGLGFNLMNAMIQPLGLTQSMVRIGPQWVAKGIAEWAKSPVGLVRQVFDKSEFMKNRSRTFNRELNEIQSVVQGKTVVRQKLDAMMYVPMQSMQLIADLPTWWGAYQKALAQAPVDMAPEIAEERAIKLADQAVIDAQAGGQVKDLAAIQRGNDFKKLFTVFYGFFSASYNLGVERAKATNYRNPLEVMHLASDFLLLYTIPAVLSSMLYDALQPGGDDDWDELVRKLIGAHLSYLMGTMVGVREFTGAVQKVFGVQTFNGSYGGPAGLRFMQELDKFATQVSQGELDQALVRSTVNVAGVALRLPSGQINRTIDGVVAISEGKTENPAAVLFGVQKN